MSRANRRLLVVLLMVFAAAGAIAHSATAARATTAPAPDAAAVTAKPPAPTDAPDAATTEMFKQLSLFSEVMERVRADYVEPVTDEKLVEYALNGMLSSLDPHSAYLNKKNFEEMQTTTHGEFGGLGIEVTMEDGLIKVISPIDDTPAAKAGIQPNDLITHINGKPVVNLTLNEAVDKMRGEPGTKITLTLRRGGVSGKPFDVTLTRAVIHIIAVKWEPKQDVAYIRISKFNEQTQSGLDTAMDEADKKIGPKLIGYVVDLRNNPGGLLDQAVSVAGTFLEAGKEVVSTRGRHKEESQSYSAKGGDRAHGKPVVVLINGGSASASEIVAGALQDHRRAVLIGTKSFGKGSVQTIIPISDAGAMLLTTSRYYTPSGRSIQQLGIEPDITVQPAKLEALEQSKGLREADLRGAISNDTLKNGGKDADANKSGGDDATAQQPADDSDEDDIGVKKPDDKSKDKSGKKPEQFDYQLDRALDLIRGVHLFQSKAAAASVAEAGHR